MEKFSNIRRNPNRQRRVSGRTRVRPYQSMTPMGEAMMARELGLDEQTAYDIEVEDNKPATDFNNNIRIWE